MNTTEEKVKLLTDQINKAASNLDEDYISLAEVTSLSEERLDQLMGDALMMEIEKLVVMFETGNPEVFITSVQRLEDADGNMIVNLDWDHITQE